MSGPTAEGWGRSPVVRPYVAPPPPPPEDPAGTVADLLDAIDPTLPPRARDAAGLRAVGRDPIFAAGWLLELLREMVPQLANALGVDADELVLTMRRRALSPGRHPH